VSARAPKVNGHRLPILVVEDEPDIRQLVTEILESVGCDVLEASDGTEALSVLERHRVSLILLDMRMPVLDGWGFARAARQRGIDVPIVVMTAAENAKRWAREVGATDFVAKPFDVTALVATVLGARTN
jgi:two-component system chemotaxis response regulator CheY